MKPIQVTRHAKKRGKERLSLNESAIKRMFTKAIQSKAFIYDASKGLKVIKKNNIKFLYDDDKNKYVIVTITNLNNIRKHKESQRVPVYINGERSSKTVRLRG